MPYLDSAQQALPYQAGSDTSHDAAERVKKFAHTQGARYYTWLRIQRQCGGTDREAETWLRMLRSSICARRNELIMAGLVERVPGVRRGGCAVWRATT